MEVEARGQVAPGGFFEGGVGFQDGVPLVIDDSQPARGEDRVGIFGDEQDVVQVDGLDCGADVVEAVGAPADDPQVEVELGTRGEREGQPVDLSSAR